MAGVWFICGYLGSGKGKTAIRMMRDALARDRRVATNIDVNLEGLCRPTSKRYVTRVPDYPTVADLELLGSGNESYDERKNGLLVLDELGAWMNARTFNDKERMPVLQWLIHSRKKGWNVVFIAQGVGMVDRQVRDNIIQYVTYCRSVDRMQIPGVSQLVEMIVPCFTGKPYEFRIPHFHVSLTRLGANRDDMVIERSIYTGTDLHKAYDTRQVFTHDYPHGVHSVLPAWHTLGRYQARSRGLWERLAARVGWGGAQRPARPHGRPQATFSPALLALPPAARFRVARDLLARGVDLSAGGAGRGQGALRASNT